MHIAPSPAPSPTPGEDVTAEKSTEKPARRRILEAAFSAFMAAGYTETSTLEIARRARVSKRELYALVGTKQEMLAACIHERAERLPAPVDLPEPADRRSLHHSLVAFGTQILRETTDPTVIAVFRLAIAEATRTPEIARTLDSVGRRTSRAALIAIITQARENGLLDGLEAELAEQFAGLLWGDLMTSLLLGIANTPSLEQIATRANRAAAAFLRLHPAPGPTSG